MTSGRDRRRRAEEESGAAPTSPAPSHHKPGGGRARQAEAFRRPKVGAARSGRAATGGRQTGGGTNAIAGVDRAAPLPNVGSGGDAGGVLPLDTGDCPRRLGRVAGRPGRMERLAGIAVRGPRLVRSHVSRHAGAAGFPPLADHPLSDQDTQRPAGLVRWVPLVRQPPARPTTPPHGSSTAQSVCFAQEQCSSQATRWPSNWVW